MLLPWYVNGSLKPEERLHVEKHTQICIACKREMASQKLLLDLSQTSNMGDIAANASFYKLKQQIREKNHLNSCRTPSSKLWRSFFQGKNVQWPDYLIFPPKSLAIATVLFVIGFPLFFNVLKNADFVINQSSPFKTLSSPQITTLSDRQIRLVLNGNLNDLKAKGLFSEISTIEKNESADGIEIYTLTASHDSQVSNLVSELRTYPEVLLAESLHSSGARESQ